MAAVLFSHSRIPSPSSAAALPNHPFIELFAYEATREQNIRYFPISIHGKNELSKTEKPKLMFRLFSKDLAATYSRGSYTTTTIGKTAFDGRVRNGNGSDHSFIATKK